MNGWKYVVEASRCETGRSDRVSVEREMSYQMSEVK